MKRFYHMVSGVSYDCELMVSSYRADKNQVALLFLEYSPNVLNDDQEVVLTATVYVEGLNPDEVAIKDYSENEGVLNTLLANDIVEPPHRVIQSGYVNLPICKLKD